MGSISVHMMMRLSLAVLVSLAFLLVAVPGVSAAYSFTLVSSADEANIGDAINFKGSVEGLNTISVYLFVTGPGLDPNGATLENIRIPAKGGMITTVPVKLVDNTWQYTWDTAAFSDAMQPGYYTVYVVAAPMGLGRLSMSGEPFASKTILFLKTAQASTTPESPLCPFVAIAAIGMTLLGSATLTRRNGEPE